MASLVVRGLDQDAMARLRVRAARHRRSVEAEVRAILSEVLASSDEVPPSGLGSRIHARFAALGAIEVDLPSRRDLPRSAEFDDFG
jgi:plasmid stability protein